MTRLSEVCEPAEPVSLDAEVSAVSSDSLDDDAPLDHALRQTEAVRQKVDTVVEDLGTTNKAVKRRLSQGIDTVPAGQSLHLGERIESTVKEVAEELHAVNGVLSQGIEQLESTEIELAEVQEALSQTEDALAESQRKEGASLRRALHDALTGLPNRELFGDRLTQAIAMAERHAWTLAVMFMDLDRFKQINDEHGHAAGDAVLQETARRLTLHSRDEDTVCRLGGDEFLVLLINPQGVGTVERVALALQKELTDPIEVGGVMLNIASSIGIACYPEHATTDMQLVARADAAMYAAKQRGGGVHLWNDGDSGPEGPRNPTLAAPETG